MAITRIPEWKASPFVRILPPFIAGILFEAFQGLQQPVQWIFIAASLTGLLVFHKFTIGLRYKYAWINGFFLYLLLFASGCLAIKQNDTSGMAKNAENAFTDSSFILVTISEPLTEKTSSWKTTAGITGIQNSSLSSGERINLILYFRKDSLINSLQYGDQILFRKKPERIKNFDASGSFDYVKYCALKNIYFQVHLKTGEYKSLKQSLAEPLQSLLFMIQKSVTEILKKNIPSKKESGFAEALLIGYKNDVDQTLLNAYSNTGVIHVVAISGLHLGLIYALLKHFCIPLRSKKIGRWLTPAFITGGLWIFSLLAGGAPSVLRSALMFSCIVIGEGLKRKTSIINNLAASAFMLLCYDPYWLWDIGFQLSYAALLSIVLFMKPVYHLLIFENKMADLIWKLNAVTLSAQILTVPISIFYFHQFPNLFLITNFIAVPLSSTVLIGEIVICLISFLPGLSLFIGKIVCFLIRILNGTIEWMDSFRYSTFTGIYLNLPQLVCLYLFIFSISCWLMLKQNKYLFYALTAVILFMADKFI